MNNITLHPYMILSIFPLQVLSLSICATIKNEFSDFRTILISIACIIFCIIFSAPKIFYNNLFVGFGINLKNNKIKTQILYDDILFITLTNVKGCLSITTKHKRYYIPFFFSYKKSKDFLQKVKNQNDKVIINV